jgi:endonuclease YncB( thermonuclease family)
MVVVTLLSAAIFFGTQAESRRQAVQQAAGGLENGDFVTLTSVLDGDTVLVKSASGEPITVRILGVKAFPSEGTHDGASAFGVAAVDALRRMLEGHSTRVILNEPKKDASGRTLATLYVNDQDVGLTILKEGLVLVYTAFPFPAMSLYLQAQDAVKEQKRGIWGNPVASHRAELLAREWRLEQKK